MFQSYSTQNVILYFDKQWPGVYPQPGMVRHKMLLFYVISFSVTVVLLFLSSSVTTVQGSPLAICCACRLLLFRYTLPLKTETSQVEFSHLNFLNGRPSLSSFYAASYPDVSLLMKMCAQRKAGRRQRARRLADLVFKMAARVMADQYAIFKISSALFICEFWANHCLSTSCVWRGSCFHPTHWTQAS